MIKFTIKNLFKLIGVSIKLFYLRFCLIFRPTVMATPTIMKTTAVTAMDKPSKVIFHIPDPSFSLITILRSNLCIKVSFFLGAGLSVVHFDSFCDISFILEKLFLGQTKCFKNLCKNQTFVKLNRSNNLPKGPVSLSFSSQCPNIHDPNKHDLIIY